MTKRKSITTSVLFVLAVSAFGGCEPETIDELLSHISDAVDDADGNDVADTGADTLVLDTGIQDTDAVENPVLTDVEVSECDGAPAARAEIAMDTERPEGTELPEDAEPSDLGTYIVTRGDTVTLYDEDVPVNCCADLVVRAAFENNLILVTETEVVGEQGLCRCMCTRDVTAVVEGLTPGAKRLEVQRISADGTVITVGSFSFECVETPDEWGYRGVTCVN